MIKGVITGDIVDSTLVPIEFRHIVIDIMNKVVDDFTPLVKVDYEIYRGDSFQVVVEDIAYALEVAIAIRSALRSITIEGQDSLDARLSIGIGEISFLSDSILTSDGEAFRYSGREFDALGKKRLSIKTPWENINDELRLSTMFADAIISNWTSKQAEIIYKKILSNESQTDLAEKMGTSVQNFNKIWNLGYGALILEYIKRYKQLILSKTNE